MKVIKQLLFYLLSVMLTTLMLGCGEAEYSLDDVSPFSYGKFIDDAVEGLEYTRSSGDSAVTDRNGNYSYKQGELITFNVGAANIGTAPAGFVITPRELASEAKVIEDPRVYNRVRFLKALDSSYGIGIEINTTIKQQASYWESTIDFNKDPQAFEVEVARVTHGQLTLKHSKDIAIAQFKKTLSCVYSGAYQGSWNDPDSEESTGYVGVMLQADSDVYVMGDEQDIPAVQLSDALVSPDGTVFPEGSILDAQDNSVIYVVGKHDINDKSYSFDTNVSYYYNKQAKQIIGVRDDNNRISGIGKSLTYDHIDGTFTKGGQQGSYAVNRADASRNASFRYTGLGVQPGIGVIGLLIMDIEKDGKVVGLIHDARDTTIQPQLQGTTNFTTGDIDITVNMDGVLSRLTGNLYENDTPTEQLRDVNLSWHNIDDSTDIYGYVEIDGCQLQAIY